MRVLLLTVLLILSACSSCMREDMRHGDCNWIENGDSGAVTVALERRNVTYVAGQNSVPSAIR